MKINIYELANLYASHVILDRSHFYEENNLCKCNGARHRYVCVWSHIHKYAVIGSTI